MKKKKETKNTRNGKYGDKRKRLFSCFFISLKDNCLNKQNNHVLQGL